MMLTQPPCTTKLRSFFHVSCFNVLIHNVTSSQVYCVTKALWITKTHFQVGQAVVEKDVPSVQKDLLLAHTQQTRYQRIQSLRKKKRQINDYIICPYTHKFLLKSLLTTVTRIIIKNTIVLTSLSYNQRRYAFNSTKIIATTMLLWFH